jgi:hypothetical protein
MTLLAGFNVIQIGGGSAAADEARSAKARAELQRILDEGF